MVNCRGCDANLSLTFLDLGASPIANDLISFENLDSPEVYYPLHVMTCVQCAFVQIPEVKSRESLFRSDYVYFSSYSSSWLEHSQKYASKMVEMLDLSEEDLVVEVASNDGYLLQYFKQDRVQVLGVEPSFGVANVAISKGIPTLVDFFGGHFAKGLVATKKPTHMPAIVVRRHKLAKKLWEQIQLAKSHVNHTTFTVNRRITLKDTAGNYRTVERPKRIRPWWFVAPDGTLCVSIYYGSKCLEIAQGRTAATAKNMTDLITVLEILKQETEAGYFDQVIERASGCLKMNFTKKASGS